MTSPRPEKARVSRWKKFGGLPFWVSVGVHLVLLAVALIWVFKVVPASPEKQYDFISRPSGGGGGDSIRNTLQQKSRASFSTPSTARIAAADVAADITLPDPGASSPVASLSAAGGGSSLGNGLGSGGGSGGGTGTEKGPGYGPGLGAGTLRLPSVRFFDQEVKATRVAYVIDFSKSMNGKRQKLMRAELTKSVSRLSADQDYQLVFFAGPVWVAGSTITMATDQKSGVVTSPNGREHRWAATQGGRWEVSGRAPEATWLHADKAALEKSVATIRQTELVNGTYWKPAIDMALDLKPAPEIIYFMTDGIVSRNVDQTIDELARTARRKKCVINTIAMMEPEAADAMRDLAEKSGGRFTMIHPDGTTTLVKAGD